MTSMIFQLLGGIGLFLMGMVLLTDGLKSFAGDALRRALVQFTGTPVKAFVSGTLVTALVQSSSATTLTVIGFVSAGLISFPQAVGVVMGASLGTTATGWVVATVGLKISLGFYALPLVGVGAFLRILGQGRWRAMGLALAGFGLIFVGIDTLQLGMQSVAETVEISALPSGGVLGPLVLVLIGTFLTIVMQSSSAAAATILTAVHSGAIDFNQAAALIIGAAIGTTVTGILAAIGGSAPARRTALAHVVFNLATGLIALVLLPLFLWVTRQIQLEFDIESGAVGLAVFHSLFITVGVILFLPFCRQFSDLVERLIPDYGPATTRHLDDSLFSVPSVALEVSRRALCQVAIDILRVYQEMPGITKEIERSSVERALLETQMFFSRIPPINEDEPFSETRVAQLHAIDHLNRMMARMHPSEKIQTGLTDQRIKQAYHMCQDLLHTAQSGLAGHLEDGWVQEIASKSAQLSEFSEKERSAILNEDVRTSRDANLALELLDTLRWIDRVSYHTWRTCYYLGLKSEIQSKPDPAS